jgi:6-phosphofructokinase
MTRKRRARIRRIALSTGGGDAPGLNAVIRGVVMSAHHHGWDCVGIRDGYAGLLDPPADGSGLIRLTPDRVRNITHLGGTIIGTTNVGNPLYYPTKLKNGRVVERDRSSELVRAFRRAKIDACVAIGGDGSLAIANVLAKKGLRVVGVPKTIDNDLSQTAATFGFDTAVSFATECIERLHTTAASHRRVIVVEVMGRYAGWIALNAGVSSDAHVILIPEIPYRIERAAERLGGIGKRVAGEIGALTGKETRDIVLGHLLRGGAPTTFDRLISLRFGGAAVRALAEGRSGVMVALAPPTVRYVPLAKVARKIRNVPPHCDTIRTARDLGICFGD